MPRSKRSSKRSILRSKKKTINLRLFRIIYDANLKS